MIAEPVALIALLMLIVFGMIWLDRFPKFRKLGTAASCILFAMALSNMGLIPGQSPVYDFFTGYGVLAGTALILLSVDLSSIKAAGTTMAKAFFIGAFGSVIGAMIMGYFLFPALGDETYKLSGQFAATYIGGGLNFSAIGYAFDTASELFTAGIAADVIITAFWLVTCLAAPIFLKSEPPKDESNSPESATASASGSSLAKALFSSGNPIELKDLGALAAITVSTIWLSSWLATASFLPTIPSIFWLTTIVLLLAQLPAVRSLSGAAVVGNYMILLFLACNGAKSVVAKIIEVGPEVFYFAVGTVTIHGVIIFGVGRLMRIDAGTLAIASQANIGGGASAMAIATARGYNNRILPGIAVGLIGTAVGNYAGLAVGNLMKVLL